MSGWYYYFSTSPPIAALRVWGPYCGRASFIKKFFLQKPGIFSYYKLRLSGKSGKGHLWQK